MNTRYDQHCTTWETKKIFTIPCQTTRKLRSYKALSNLPNFLLRLPILPSPCPVVRSFLRKNNPSSSCEMKPRMEEGMWRRTFRGVDQGREGLNMEKRMPIGSSSRRDPTLSLLFSGYESRWKLLSKSFPSLLVFISLYRVYVEPTASLSPEHICWCSLPSLVSMGHSPAIGALA
jgi:hypothetical protein